MLDKLKFNNLVISNKKGIQQSRIQTINKLVHKIRKLKTLLEKHPDNKKCKERIRKSTETMEILKKLKRMDVMKNVLLMNKPATAIITNGIATPEEVAIALVSMNKVMQGLIKRFKTELKLNETESDEWKVVLMESSKRRLKIERTEEKRRKRLELKEQKVQGRKRQEWLEENQHSIGENISFEDDLNASTTGVWQVEELANDINTSETNEKIEKKSNKESKRLIKENPVINKTFLSNKKQKDTNRKECRDVKNKELEAKRESGNELNDIKEKRKIFDTQLSESSNNIEEDNAASLVVDPFFITDNGENYLSTAVNKTDMAEQKHNETRDLHMIKLNNYDKKPVDFRDRRHPARDKYQNHFIQKGQQSVNKGEHENKWSSKHKIRTDTFLQHKAYDNNIQIRKDVQHKRGQNRDEKNLHPSWAAKQKLKPVITAFEGKKTTFEDDDFKESNRARDKVIKTSSSLAPKLNYSEKDSLHPSWAAKLKLKPSITAFQGKKIMFDNSE